VRVELPGLFDLQVNGFAGVDYNDPRSRPDDVLRSIEALRATGVTRFLPTLITSSLDRFALCARTLCSTSPSAIAGLHMEGPYISPEDGPRGAHDLEYVKAASVADFERRQEVAGGKIRLVTLAPEVPGALGLTEHLVASGIRVAIGHTAASPGQIRDAIQAGATLSTHLGNACTKLIPRHPNFLWEQLAADSLYASFIVDGHHLPPATLKAMIRAKTPARTILVTDAVAAAGCAPGEYELGGLRVVLDEEGRVRPRDKPWLAGSAITLDRAVANTARFTGLPIEDVWPMASSRPAGYLGLEPQGRVVADWNPVDCRLNNLKVLEG
jgi:N-acetylglucosamine-6-phosphate deacetylase